MTAASQPRILVVDDEPPIVELVRGYLAREGWAVESAADGIEAVERTRSGRPDVVVLDVMLPGLDGVEACSRHARRRSTGSPPRIPMAILRARFARGEISREEFEQVRAALLRDR